MKKILKLFMLFSLIGIAGCSNKSNVNNKETVESIVSHKISSYITDKIKSNTEKMEISKPLCFMNIRRNYYMQRQRI